MKSYLAGKVLSLSRVSSRQSEPDFVTAFADHFDRLFVKKPEDCGLDTKLRVERKELVSQFSDSWWVPCWSSEQVEDLPLYYRAWTLRMGSLLDRLPRWTQQGDRTPSYPSRGLLGCDYDWPAVHRSSRGESWALTVFRWVVHTSQHYSEVYYTEIQGPGRNESLSNERGSMKCNM